MVISVGCNYESGDFICYDSTTKKVKKFNLLQVQDGNMRIEEFRELLYHNVQDSVDHLCVILDQIYDNNVHKELILMFQKIVKNIKIISVMHAKLCCAIEALSFLPVAGDSIWVISNDESLISCNIWIYNNKKEWQYDDYFLVNKATKGLGKSLTISDWRNIKSKISGFHTSQYICVFSKVEFNQMQFNKIFSSCRKKAFLNLDKSVNGALNYSRFISKEIPYSKYKIRAVFDKNLFMLQNDIEVFELNNVDIPLNETKSIMIEKGDVLRIYEEPAADELIIVAECKVQFDLTLAIDVNGIYSFHARNIIVYDEVVNLESRTFPIPKQNMNYNPDLNSVGIDFGTTECCAAVIRKNGPDFVVLDSVTSYRTLPSYISFDEAIPKCGQIVIDRLRHKSEFSVYDIKRIMGKQYNEIVIDPLWPFKIKKFHTSVLQELLLPIKQLSKYKARLLPSEKFLLDGRNTVFIETENSNGTVLKSSEEVSAVLLSHIKNSLELYQNSKLSKAVITIPSNSSDHQKQSLMAAAEMAGWTNIIFLHEPIAAAFAYLNITETAIPDNSNIIICDCGGGTFDICVAKVSNEYLEILSVDGDSYLGGRDFDNILFTHFNGILKHKFNYDVKKNRKKYLLKKKCQEIKHTLSAAEEDWLDVDNFDNTVDEIIKITKIEFEEMSSSLIVKMKDVILLSLSKGNIPVNEINYVFQVGGGCRMPMIKNLLFDIFPYSVHDCSLYPDWAVAHGAALYAHYLDEHGTLLKNANRVPSWLTKLFEV